MAGSVDDNPEWTAEDFARARKGDDLPAAIVASFRHAAGRPETAFPASKQQVTLRLDRDVLGRWRASGPGWQQRMNAALRAAAPES